MSRDYESSMYAKSREMPIVLSAILAVAMMPASVGATATNQALLPLGTFTCVTHDTQAADAHFTSINSMFGPWVHAHISSPAENKQPLSGGKVDRSHTVCTRVHA